MITQIAVQDTCAKIEATLDELEKEFRQLKALLARESGKIERKKRRVTMRYGYVRDYLAPYLSGLTVGQFTSVPLGEFSGHALASRCSAYCIALWGVGSVTVHYSKKLKCIGVTRIK